MLGRRGLGLFAELGGGCSFVFDIYSFAVCVRCGANHSEGGNNGIYFLICRGDMAVICKYVHPSSLLLVVGCNPLSY